MTQWYYTKAGEQQGPITLDELKGLFASGALDPDQDLVWTTTMSDWVPISQVPEITSGEPVPAQEQLQQPFAYPTATGAFEEIEAGTEPIIPTACVKRAFDLTVRNLGPLVVVMLVVVGITFAADFILEMLRVAIVGSDAAVQYNTVGSDNLSASQSQLSAAETVMVLVLNIISSLITLFLTLGGLRISLNVVSGKPFTVGMLFGQGDKMVRAFFAQILFAIMVGVGLIFLIVPGVYLALRYGQFMTAIVDKDMGIMDSFKYSSQITQNNRLNLLVIWLFSFLIVIAGCLALIVGLLFAYPMMALMWVIAYRWMQYGGRAVLDDPITQKPVLSELPD